MKINFVLSKLSAKEVEKHRVIYEYANQLALSNHNVAIYHQVNLLSEKGNTPISTKLKLKFQQHILRKKINRKPSWFDLHPSIVSFEIIDISNDLIRDALFIISTSAGTALEVFNLSPAKGVKFDFIQNSEIPVSQPVKEAVIQSYKLPINRIVTSGKIKEEVAKYTSTEPMLITAGTQNSLNGYQPQMQDLLHASLSYIQRLQFT